MDIEHVTKSDTHVQPIIEEVKHGDAKALLVVEDSPDFSSPSSVASYSSHSSFGEFNGNENEKDTHHTDFQIDGNSQPDSTHNPHWGTLRNSSQMKFPPPQTMGRPGEYDPTRIPTSIFSSKPSNQTDWSVASNESLFSIHMGNNSFSRDHSFFGKSGELPRFDDWSNSQSNWSNSQPNLPPVMEVPANEDNEIEDLQKIPTIAPVASTENPVKEIIAPVEVDPAPVPYSPVIKVSSPAERSVTSSSGRTSPADRSLSDGSGNSYNSFAFPVLVSDGTKSSSSLNVVVEKPEKPELESPQAPRPTPPKGTGMKWSSCFSWPKCC